MALLDGEVFENSWKLEVGRWKLEDGSRKTEDGSWKLEVACLPSGREVRSPSLKLRRLKKLEVMLKIKMKDEKSVL